MATIRVVEGRHRLNDVPESFHDSYMLHFTRPTLSVVREFKSEAFL